MKKTHRAITVTGVIVDEAGLSITEICHRYTISEQFLFELAEQGLFHSKTVFKKNSQLDANAIQRLESALRLQRDLGVNVPGAVLAIELSEKLEKLRKELEFLRKHLAQDQ